MVAVAEGEPAGGQAGQLDGGDAGDRAGGPLVEAGGVVLLHVVHHDAVGARAAHEGDGAEDAAHGVEGRAQGGRPVGVGVGAPPRAHFVAGGALVEAQDVGGGLDFPAAGRVGVVFFPGGIGLGEPTPRVGVGEVCARGGRGGTGRGAKPGGAGRELVGLGLAIHHHLIVVFAWVGHGEGRLGDPIHAEGGEVEQAGIGVVVAGSHVMIGADEQIHPGGGGFAIGVGGEHAVDLVHVIDRQAEVGAGGGRPIGVVEHAAGKGRVGRTGQTQAGEALGRAQGGASRVGIEGGETLGLVAHGGGSVVGQIEQGLAEQEIGGAFAGVEGAVFVEKLEREGAAAEGAAAHDDAAGGRRGLRLGGGQGAPVRVAEEIFPAPGERDHGQELKLEAADVFSVALVDLTVAVDAPVEEGAHGLGPGGVALGVEAGQALDGAEGEEVREIPSDPVHVAKTHGAVLAVAAAAIGGLGDDAAHQVLLGGRHPLAGEIEAEAEVHLRDEGVHAAPVGGGAGALELVVTEIGVGHGEVSIYGGFTQAKVGGDGGGGLATAGLVAGEQAVERHGAEALGHIGDVGVVDAGFLPVEHVRQGKAVGGGEVFRGPIDFPELQVGGVAGGEFDEESAVAGRGIPPRGAKQFFDLDQRQLPQALGAQAGGEGGHVGGAEEDARILAGRRRGGAEQG